MTVSNEVLGEKISHSNDIIVRVEKKLDDFIEELEKVKDWKSMMNGALLIMNIFLVPVAIWAIITLISKLVH